MTDTGGFDEFDETDGGVSRRRIVLGGLGVAAGASALVATVTSGTTNASAASVPILEGVHPSVLSALNPVLTYLPIDAVDFFPAGNHAADWVNDDDIGTSVNAYGASVQATVPLPSGSIIRQIHIAYRGAPTVGLFARSLNAPTPPIAHLTTALVAGPGAKTQTIDLDISTPSSPPFPLSIQTTYSLRFVINNPKTDSIYGVTIGFTPPTQSYVPVAGATRVYDTRSAALGGPAKLAAGEERTVLLGFNGARSAVINLTVTDTEGGGGFVAAYAADVVWPGNSSVNWSGPNQIVANAVITSMDPFGQIKIRGGVQSTHVVIDRIGYLL